MRGKRDSTSQDMSAYWWYAATLGFLIVIMIGIPAVLVRHSPNASVSQEEISPTPQVIRMSEPEAAQVQPDLANDIQVSVFLTEDNRVAKMALEQYVLGVVAGEMPMQFEMEALKAQAIASRTYIVRRMYEKDYSGMTGSEAIVTDSVQHQVYKGEEKLRQSLSQNDYTYYIQKLRRAVQETEGLILTYQHKPINATFFSTSNGYTENSEDYWDVSVPYLRSVASPWDESLSPNYKTTISMPYESFLYKLGLNKVRNLASSRVLAASVLEVSEGHRIKRLQIGEQQFTGREIRERLELASSQFSWKIVGETIEITTYGYGHGVGMSQWGANGMAKEGRSAAEILSYYYKDIELERADVLLNSKKI